MAISLCRGSTSLTCRSSMKMDPDVTSSSPATIRSAVVLPQPDGPTRTSSSPSSIWRSSDCTAVVPSGYCLVTESSTIRDTFPASLPSSPGSLAHAESEPLDQVPLEDQVHGDGRQGADQRACHQRRDGGGAPGRERGQPDGDGPVAGVLQEEQADQQVIPDLDELEHRDSRDGRQRERDGDLQERPLVAQAVHDGGLDQ